MGKKKKKAPKLVSKIAKKNKPKSFTEQLKDDFREKRIPESFFYNYHTIAFHYFHTLIEHRLPTHSKYRTEFWENIPNGIYNSDKAQQYLTEYKKYIELKLKEIIQKYSLVYWMHVSRRIAPNTVGDDHRPETIRICRNIITAAIQKDGQFSQCGNIEQSTEVEVDKIFKGLFLKPEFYFDRQNILKAPKQLVLTNFDENNILEYYQLELLAYELWLIGSKCRIIAKGADLVVDISNPKILLDNRSSELESLIENFDNRTTVMNASATGTVFRLPTTTEHGDILLTQIFTDRSEKTFSDPISKLLEINFHKGQFPNFEFCNFDIKMFLQVHMEFAPDFFKKWAIKLDYAIAIIADLGLALLNDMIVDKNVAVAANMFFRSYRIYNLHDYKKYIEINWPITTKYMGVEIPFDQTEVDRAFNFLSLNATNREQIFVDSFGPLKIFIPGMAPEDIIIDFSVIDYVLYNLFHGLPLKERGFKGELLERVLKKKESFLPTTESKGLDGTAKQVDFSVARGDVLVLAECKAVARSFGIFAGQRKALEHRLRNVINKGIDDVDEKVKWFLNHQKGTNFDISGFKFIVGVAVSPFAEFMPSRADKYWLNDNLPRVLTIEEFEKLIESDLKKIITKNIVPIN